MGELGIAVPIAGHRAFVSGNVATPERQQAISEVVAEVLPGYEVHNDVGVTSLALGSGTETLT